jgi:hypothetical protein
VAGGRYQGEPGGPAEGEDQRGEGGGPLPDVRRSGLGETGRRDSARPHTPWCQGNLRVQPVGGCSIGVCVI